MASDHRASPHVIVVTDEDADSCRGATALHIAVGLLACGQRVASIDLDSSADGLSHCLAMRRRQSGGSDRQPAMPDHHRVALPAANAFRAEPAAAPAAFDRAIAAIGQDYDFVVIASPRRDGDLLRLVHALADTVVTPLTDGVVEIDALGTLDPATLAITDPSVYAAMVVDARRQRRRTDDGRTDWVVLCDRPTSVNSAHRHLQARQFSNLATRLAFRMADNLCDFSAIGASSRGVTAFDDAATATNGTAAARLVEALRLPLDQRRRGLVDARAQWAAASALPLETDDIFA